MTAGGQGSMDGTERPIILTEFPHSCVHLSPSGHQSFFSTDNQVAAMVLFSFFGLGELKPPWTITQKDY